MKINIPIWGLINSNDELVYWADDKKNCLENKWHEDEKLIKLKIVAREE